jgi:hypothetical protein
MQYSAFGMHDWAFWFNFFVAAMIILGHRFFGAPESIKPIVVMGLLVLVWFGWSFGLGFFSEIRASDALAGLVSYSVCLFVFLSDLLLYKFGSYLTKKRGDKWVKEIDYIYLSLGAVGLVFSVEQIKNAVDKISAPTTLGLLAVATALVFRAVKTRAEIGNWAKQPAVSIPSPRSSPPTTTSPSASGSEQ